MTATTVAYHADGASPARPAINVKCYTSGQALWPEAFSAAAVSDATARYGPPWTDYLDAASDRVQSDFWQAASEIADQRGLGDITQEGRSGGWLVFTSYDPNGDPEPDDPFRAIAWLEGYRAMVEWAEAYIADAPRRVRSLAQDAAMDTAGESTVTLRSWLAWGRGYAL